MVPGVHFDESFAPTPMTQSIRTVLAMSLFKLGKLGDISIADARKKWIAGDIFDVVQAFLNSKMTGDPVYIYPPPRWKEYCLE